MRPETYISEKIGRALQKAYRLDELPAIGVEKPRQEAFGDFATTVALSLAKTLRTAPRAIAETIVQNLVDDAGRFAKISIDGPGFINFTMSAGYWQSVLANLLAAGAAYGDAGWGQGQKVQVEFVSANPTGPLNVVSARAAAVGDVLVTLFNKVGFDAAREYYINDAGRQVRLMGASVSARYMQLFGHEEPVPEDGYQGEYITDLAREIQAELGDKFVALPQPDRAEQLAQIALEKMIRHHQEMMRQYRVEYQVWYRESELRQANKHLQVMEQLRERGFVYEKDGAVWFKSTEFGDEKDRVLVTSGGEPTYFLVDIAYHQDKYARGFEKIYDLLGPDHHGYIKRMSAAMQALGHPADSFEVRLIQQVNMLRGGEVVKMSKRRGNIIEMRELIDEVGVDAARFFFLMRRLDSPMDFDIDLAKKQTDENPVFYVQYAHARCVNIQRHAEAQGVSPQDEVDLSLLTAKEEMALIKKLADYPNVISSAARLLEPHQITTYLMELAGVFHSFYHVHRVVTDDRPLTLARLKLVEAFRLVLKNALDLMRITAPERM